MTPLDTLKLIKQIYLTSLRVYQALWSHKRKHCVNLSLFETLLGPSYDIFNPMTHLPNLNVQFVGCWTRKYRLWVFEKLSNSDVQTWFLWSFSKLWWPNSWCLLDMFKNMEVNILDLWNVFKSMRSKSWIWGVCKKSEVQVLDSYTNPRLGPNIGIPS